MMSYNKKYNILGSTWGSPCFRKRPIGPREEEGCRGWGLTSLKTDGVQAPGYRTLLQDVASFQQMQGTMYIHTNDKNHVMIS